MMKKLLVYVISTVLGVVSAVVFLQFGGTIPIRFDNPTLTKLHVEKPQVVGFLPYWLLSKADKEYSEYITTLTYFGIGLNSDGSILKRTNPQETEPGWYALQGDAVAGRLADAGKKGMKKSLLIISGDDEIISGLLNDPVMSATTMMSEVAPIMKEKQFEDLNIDIETFMEASPSSQAKFTLFIQTVKDFLVRENLGTLTIDLIPIALVQPKLYDMKALGALADAIVLMTYDYHYSGSFTSGAVAPIGGAGETLEFDVEIAVKEALKIIPKEKILLGIPLYGYQWETIEQASESATIAGGSETASVRTVMEKIKSCIDCISGYDAVSQSPYLIYPDNDVYKQVYFENEESMKAKIAIAQKYNLGGVALWALGYEDESLLKPLSSYKSSMSLSW